MKVLYYHQYFSTPEGSTGTRSFCFANKLIESGHEVTIVCLKSNGCSTGLTGQFENGKREGIVKGIKIIEFNIKYSNYLNLFDRANAFLKYSLIGTHLALISNPDIIFATSTPLTVGIPGIFSRWIKGTPFVFEVRDQWPYLPVAMGVIKNKFVIHSLSILEWLSYHSADSCVALSPGIKDGILSINSHKNSVRIIPNACDLDIFYPKINKIKKSKYDILDVNKEYSDDTFIAAFTGAHGKANGLDFLLDSAYELKKMGKDNIKIVLIGDGKEKPYLLKRAIKENLDNCYFLDPMPKMELAKLLREDIDVGLMILKNVPAFYQGTSPNKFFDYLSTGLPILINYPGWLAKVIKDQDIGIVVPPDEPKIMAKYLVDLSNSPIKLNKMSKNARRVAEDKFSRTMLAEEWKDLIETNYRTFNYRRKNYLPRMIYLIFKEIIDRSLAATMLLLMLPFLILIYILIGIKLGKPVFFIQERPGKDSKPFKLYKFRSMKTLYNAEGNLLPDKKRSTSFGNWLRKTSIDELPGLINVCYGDMSFIGPRPLLMKYLLYYSEEQSKRHNVKPGLSGLAQIKGRNNISWEKKFNYDIWYVENQSLLLDIKIFLLTIYKVIRRDGINPKGRFTMPEFKGSNND